MAIANISFALFAGLFSILSPCVLPLVPVVLGTAVAEHKLAPAAGYWTRAFLYGDRALRRHHWLHHRARRRSVSYGWSNHAYGRRSPTRDSEVASAGGARGRSVEQLGRAKVW